MILFGLSLSLFGCRAIRRPTRTAPAGPSLTPTSPAPTSPSETPTLVVPAQPLGTPAPSASPTLPPSTSGPERLIGTYVPPKQVGQYCQEMASYGARFTWTAVPWNVIEPVKGVFSWKTADSVIMTMHNCGFDIGVHVLSRNSWATLPVPNIPTKAIASMPPKDMNDYYNFVFQLATHYKGIISRYSIENEAHASSNWPSSPQSYFQMLATAYRAIHAADPHAIVEDSAISSSGLGVLYANYLVKSGQQQQAVDFLRTYFATFAPSAGNGEPIVVNTATDMNKLFQDPEVQRLFAWAPLLFANHQYYDVEQLHYFGPWSDLPTIMGWIHSQLRAQGDDKPLDLWEMGFAWTDVKTFDPQTQAREIPKYMAVAIGEGGLRALSWLFTDFAFTAEGHPGLITDSGPRPAATSFKVVANELNGTVRSERLNLGPGVWAYRYDRSNGTVYALWSTQPTRVQLPIQAAQVNVTDYMGQTTTANPQALDVGINPIYVQAP